MEDEIGTAVAIQVCAGDDSPVAEAAAVEELRAGLEACAGGEIDGVHGAVESPHVDLAGAVLEYEIGDSISAHVRAGRDPPIAKAAAVEKLRARLESGAGGEIDRVRGAVEEPKVDLAGGIL